MRGLIAGLLLAAAMPGAVLAETADLPVTIANASGRPILCTAGIAHWVTAELAALADGQRATIRFTVDPESRTVTLANAAGRAMAVETVTCGYRDRPYETRSQLILQTPRGTALPPALLFACGAGPVRLDCRAVTPGGD